jgi:hypothetical protein
MTRKINWELEDTKRYLEEKGYKFKHELGSINYTCYVYIRANKRLEIWDDKSGELTVVNVMGRPVNIEEL